MNLPDETAVENGIQAWKGVAVAAVVATVIVVLAGAAGYSAAALFDAWSGMREPRAYAAGEYDALLTGRVACSLFAFQLVTITMVTLANAYWKRSGRPGFLSFAMPPGGVKTLAVAVIALLALATCFASLVFAFNPDALRHDLQPFSEMMKSRTWWLILLAAGVGAPLAEELLFRGLLFSALRRSPLGFPGATVITAVAWAALHANYSFYGLGAITLIGLYLAWLRERTGGLLTPIVCHGVYNSLIILLMVLAPDNALTTG